MPWSGAIPSYFIIGPDGNLQPHFIPPTNPSNPDDNTRRPIEFFFPFGITTQAPAPNPEKAKELLRAMKNVVWMDMKRVTRIIIAEEGDVGDEEERGWKCGVCLEGVGGEERGLEDETGVKGLPCNHLFHEGCLQPWFETNHTW